MDTQTPNIFIFDIPTFNLNKKIMVTGIVLNKKKLASKDYLLKLRDITGVINCAIKKDQNKIINILDNIEKLTKIRITSEIILNSKGIRILSNIEDIHIIKDKTTQLKDLEQEYREQASKMLTSRICKKVSNILNNNQFREFESRLISNKWYEDSLEPLQVIYPGFGSPAYLITSPSSQIIDFMTTTISDRAFTITSMFSSSFRYTDAGSETKIISAKSTNLKLEDLIPLIKKIASEILAFLRVRNIDINEFVGVWPDKIEDENYFEKDLGQNITLINFSTHIPIIGSKWDSNVSNIILLIDYQRNVLIEGSLEIAKEGLSIASLNVYPSQFLSLIQKAPFRQLQNLEKIYDKK